MPAREGRFSLRGIARGLFGSPLNIAITLAMIALFALTVPGLVRWGIRDGTLFGAGRKACVDGGACWIYLRTRIHDLMYGSYPAAEVWRVDLAGAMLVVLLAGSVIRVNPWRRAFVFALAFIFPVAGFLLVAGGVPGLPSVPARNWGGLMLNVVIAFIVVLFAVPLGLLLAEARRSKDGIIRALATGFIELWRAAPLVTVVFMSIYILPFLMPPGFELNKFLSVAIALVLFNSAYMAEAIRGGLQAVPAGQFQAAEALGFRFLPARLLIIWPQALRMSVPSIVNTAIDLFKDTSLLYLVGLFDLLGSVQQAVKDPQWLGLAVEGYIFTAFVFLVICGLLSAMSKSIEHELNPDRKKAAGRA